MHTVYDPAVLGAAVMPAPKRVQFVIKASKFCNLRCRYCYEYPNLGNSAVMSREQLVTLYLNIADHYRALATPVTVEFDWHGGEPLLQGAEYYWNTFDDQTVVFNDTNITVRNLVQTNLLALNDTLLELLKHGFDGVGVSIDVFGDLRVNANGKNPQTRVLQNMDLLRKADIPFGCIAVLAKQNVRHLRQMFDFFSESDISFRVLPIFEGADAAQNVAYALSDSEITSALIELFELWLASSRQTSVEPSFIPQSPVHEF